MKKKLVLILNIVLIIFVLSSFINCVEAASGGDGSVITAMKGLKDGGGKSSADDQLKPIFNIAIGFIQVTGTGISVIMVTMLGIKYMLSSPGDKADVKKQIAPLLIGAILLFASVNIVQIIANFAAGLAE